MNKILMGIDYGTKRVGVALAEGPLAEPLAILENNDHLLAELVQLVEKHHIEQIVVGLSENKMADLTHQFVHSLQQLVKMPVVFIDETLSSYEMHLKLRSAKMKKKQAPIDHLVAAQLLQEWLDSNLQTP